MAKLSAGRLAKGKRSGAASWARMGPKKDRRVAKSSHGKFKTVAELVAYQGRVESTTSEVRQKRAQELARQKRQEAAMANSGGFSDVLGGGNKKQGGDKRQGKTGA
jgi:hypothetical protein